MSLNGSNELYRNEIVIIDDSDDNLRLLAGIMKKAGFNVITELSGEIALKNIKEKMPSLILLDVMMPDMDGLEVCRRLKEDENTRDIPVVFISALNDEKSKLAGFRFGGVDYISKPFRKEEVLARVKTHFSLFRMQLDLKARNEKLEIEVLRRKQAEMAIEKRMIALTQPLEDSTIIDFDDLFNVNELQKLQDQFARAFGVAAVITQTDGTPITTPSNFSRLCQNIIRCTEKGLRNCMHSDAVIGRHNQDDPIVQPCLSGGLWDAGASITVGGKHIANWLIGQVRTEEQEESKLRGYAREIGADEEEFMKAFYEVTPMSREQFQKISEMLFAMAGQLSDMAYQNLQQARFIHDRKLAEEALIESEERYNAFINANIDMIFVKDEQFRYLMANDAMAKFFGKPKEELLNKTDQELADENTIYPCQSSDRKALTIESFFTIEEQFGDRIYETTKFPLQLKGNKKGIGGIMHDITNRKKIESALFDSEEKMDAFFEQSLDSFFFMTMDEPILWSDLADKDQLLDYAFSHLRINRVNNAMLSQYGANYNQFIGITLNKLFAHDILHGKNVYRLLFDIGKLHTETDERKFNGEQIIIEGDYTCMYDLQGRITGIFGIQRDITQNKLAIETIKNERKILRTLIDHLPDAIYVKDKDCRKTVANLFDIKNIGLASEADTLGKTDLELFKGEIGRRGYEDDLRVIEKGEAVINREEVFINRHGVQRWLLTSKLPLYDQRGKVSGLVGIGRDITEQKKSNETIQKLSKSIEQSPSSIIITDTKGNIEYVNHNFTEITGYTPEEVIGKNPRILKSGEMLPQTYRMLWATISSGEIWRGELLNRRKDGELFWEWATITSIKNENGVITNYISIKEDIRARKQLEVDLMNAKDKAEENDRLKSAFLANMSHEIRTPLNSIIGFSELLSDPEFESNQRFEFARIITNSGNNLLAIISDIMDISKIEAGQVEVRKSIFSAPKLIQDVIEEYKLKAHEKGINLKIDLTNSKKDCLIESDKTKIKQVLVNFVGNALKFTETGSIDIGFKILGNSVLFFVKDTGIGIPSEFHEQIFERFRQVETPTTRKYGGNGLGLAISKSLIEMLDGTIGMKSVPGEGSTFHFTISDVVK